MLYTLYIMKYILAALLLIICCLYVFPSHTFAAVTKICQEISPGTQTVANFPACTSVDVGALGFKIPSLGDILTFVIRAFFVIAGLAALFYMLLGAFAWVTSGGDSDAVSAAQGKIQAAVVGMLIIVGVLAIIWTLEQVIFNRRICLGLSCPLTLPGLIEPSEGAGYCCACVNKDTGDLGDVIDTSRVECTDEGKVKFDPKTDAAYLEYGT